jgi:ligand-binding sensor protein/anti-sigma regulatory factor (Ser/Thr protein kinase)
MTAEPQRLAGLIDLERVQRICESLSSAFDIALAVLDPEGNVLIASGWQDICTKFHRASDVTMAGCLESDLRINQRLVEGLGEADHIAYRCANGLWDVAFPLVVGGEHVANIYTGQFFFDDDDVDPEAFAERARRLGFDEAAYMEAFRRVPVVSHERLRKAIHFLADFVGLLGEMGMTSMLRQHEQEELRESERRYRSLIDNAVEGLIVFRVLQGDEYGPDLEIVDLNPALAGRWPGGRKTLIGRRMSDGFATDERVQAYFSLIVGAVASGQPTRRELYVEEEDTYELLTAYRAGHQVWALSTADVTEVRRAEQALRHQEEEIRRAYVDVLDAVTGGELILLTDELIPAELGEPLTDVLQLTAASQTAQARRKMMEAAEARYPGRVDRSALITPVSEALDNALKHAGGGTYQVFDKDGLLQVAISDEGPGIDFRTLPKATLVAGFSTAASLGMGFTIMLQLSERVLLATRPGHTQLVLEIATLPDPASQAGAGPATQEAPRPAAADAAEAEASPAPTAP